MAEKNLTGRVLAGPFSILGLALYLAAVAMGLGALGVGLYQCWLWRRDGHWTSFTVRYALGEPPHSTWAQWIWQQPLAAALLAAALLALLLSGVVYGIRNGVRRLTR